MSPAVASPPGMARAWYVAGLCMACLLMSFIDRQILSLMIAPVRASLHITDLQFGLLHGLAFSLFYATMGLPIATLADSSSRVRIVTIAVAFWSVATMACGLARSFAHLFIARIAVGAGEAGLAPATYSLLADLFPRDRLGRAMAVFSLGSFLGGGLAYLGGGWLIETVSAHGAQTLLGRTMEPWQIVFLLVGLPGVAIALLIAATVREPLRPAVAAGDDASTFAQTFAFLWRERATFIPHFAGFSFSAMALFGVMSWSPAYLMRCFGMTTGQAGLGMGLIILVLGSAGVVISGWLVDRLTRNGNPQAPFMVGTIGVAGTAIAGSLLFVARDGPGGLAILAVTMFFASFPQPPAGVVMQLAVPPRIRSKVSALFLFLNSLVGFALGSALIGFLNDRVFTAPDGIARSLSLVVGASAALAAMLLATPWLRGRAAGIERAAERADCIAS